LFACCNSRELGYEIGACGELNRGNIVLIDFVFVDQNR
jgi:hypothetical protein